MGTPNIDKDAIRELAELLEETGLSEIEIETGGERIKVARGGAYMPTAAPAPAPVAATAASSGDADIANHPGAVTSPMVGTIFIAPEPGAAPFVKIGDKVAAGQTLFIIEAMKTMNPVTAPRDGTVAKILISDSQPVEYGEPLLILD